MAQKVEIRLGALISAFGKVLTAVKEDDSTDLHTVCLGTADKPHAAVQVKQRYKCSFVAQVKGKPVPCGVEHSSYHPFPRGQDNGDGTFTVLSAEDLATAKASADEQTTLTLLRCPKAEVDQRGIPNGKFYYVEPGAGPGADRYSLIRDVIRAEQDKWAYVTTWAYRTAAHQVRVVLVGDVICLQQIARPAEVQQLPNVETAPYDERFLPLAMQAAELITVSYDPATFSDTRKAKIAQMLAAADTVEGSAPTVTSTPVQTADAALVELAAYIEANKKTVSPRKKAAKEAPPVQALPDPVPANVTVATPKKRAPRKAATEKRSA